MRSLLPLLLAGCAGCVGSTPGSNGSVDAPAGGGSSDGSTANPDAPAGGLEAGTLNVSWMHGSQNCATNTDPEVQVHAYNATVHIIRQNKCKTFEAPFIYVIQGDTKALSIDTGATTTTTLRTTVRGLIGTKQLIAAHSHAHGDHKAGDATFSGQPNTTLVATSQTAIQQAFGITTWPTSQGTIDLGNRVLDVLAIPGHEAQHIAIYDRKTGILFTGDSLYPGLLFINDWATYRTSMHRLAQFVASRPVSHVLGAHIEMSSTAKQVYPYGTTYQPSEHVLQLGAAHVAELDAALTQLGATPPAQSVAHDDFVIDPQ
ncbi:MAG TPA: MBL fold metallo-hydrolase [Kofleriaceae bacterium]|nr:MBL fold metallo-hydrolase [Kofleriaceae bacterium]